MIGKPLSLWHITAVIVVLSCFALLEALFGLHQLQAGHKRQALIVGISALVIFMTLPIHISNWLKVKRGVNVILRPLPPGILPQVPFAVSLSITCLLTLLIAWVTYFCYFDLNRYTRTIRQELLLAGFNLLLWLLVGLVWFCLLRTRERKQYEAVSEQVEGVWPPAPLVPVADDNKD